MSAAFPNFSNHPFTHILLLLGEVSFNAEKVACLSILVGREIRGKI